MQWGPLETFLRTGREHGTTIGARGTPQFTLDNDVSAVEVQFYLDGIGLGVFGLPDDMTCYPDDYVLAYAKSKNQILLTHDAEFFNERVHPPETNPGLVVMPGGSGDIKKFLPLIGLTLSLMKNRRGFWIQTYTRIEPSGTVTVKVPESDEHGPMRIIRIVFTGNGKPKIVSAEDWYQ